jgi:hypothetical protein
VRDAEHQAADLFVATAAKLVAHIERVAVHPAARFLEDSELLLVDLYARALRLPNVEPSDDAEWLPRVEYDGWRGVYQDIQRVLGRYDVYREIYDPAAMADPAGSIEGGDEPVVSSLADDLADIWRDLKPLVDGWPIATAAQRQDLAWDARSTFASHWGQHLVDALRAIHWWRHVHYVLVQSDRPPEA